MQQLKYDVECRHVVMGKFKVLLVTHLKLFIGSREEAYKAALLDAFVIVIHKIHYWRESPAKRLGMFSMWSSTTATRFCCRSPRT